MKTLTVRFFTLLRKKRTRLSKKGVKLQKHSKFRYARPRPGISYLYQRLVISLCVQNNERIKCGMTPFLDSLMERL